MLRAVLVTVEEEASTRSRNHGDHRVSDACILGSSASKNDHVGETTWVILMFKGFLSKGKSIEPPGSALGVIFFPPCSMLDAGTAGSCSASHDPGEETRLSSEEPQGLRLGTGRRALPRRVRSLTLTWRPSSQPQSQERDPLSGAAPSSPMRTVKTKPCSHPASLSHPAETAPGLALALSQAGDPRPPAPHPVPGRFGRCPVPGPTLF